MDILDGPNPRMRLVANSAEGAALSSHGPDKSGLRFHKQSQKSQGRHRYGYQGEPFDSVVTREARISIKPEL